MSNFEELVVWQECRKFRNEIASVAKKLPVEEKYKLNDQMLRSSRSITALIAEGHGRYHYQESMQFCRQSRGSLAETLDHLICMMDIGYITKEELGRFREQYEKCYKLINGYIAYLKSQKDQSVTK